jgi:hypothetical protein
MADDRNVVHVAAEFNILLMLQVASADCTRPTLQKIALIHAGLSSAASSAATTACNGGR